MLFEDQRIELTGTDHDLYFAGSAILKGGRVAFVTGVRTKKEPKKIVANVEYISMSGESIQVFNKELEPADFERFLNSFAMKTATISKGSCKLVELNHRFNPIPESKFDLTDQEKNAAMYTFLIQLITGNTMKDAVQAAGLIIKTYLKQKA